MNSDSLQAEIEATYGHRLRVRACGLLVENQQILLLRHEGIGEKGYLWAPPGGGVEFGERLEETLVREFAEETGLTISVQHFAFGAEYIRHTLHALELFFWVKRESGQAQLGHDPETKHTLLSHLDWKSDTWLAQQERATLHRIFSRVSTLAELRHFSGFLTQRP